MKRSCIASCAKNIPLFFKSRGLTFTDIVAALACGFLSSLLYAAAAQKEIMDISLVKNVSVLAFFAIFLLSSAIFISVSLLLKTNIPISISLALLSTGFSIVVLIFGKQSVYLFAGLSLILLIIFTQVFKSEKLSLEKVKLSENQAFIGACVLFAVFSLVIGYTSALTQMYYANSTFDFGIFSQMFENMRTTGLPLTTVERGTELSHFAVHFSPIFYLLLPGYVIFPSPLYLYYVQAFIVASGVFAVFKIARTLGANPVFSLLMSAFYILYPTMSYGIIWSFHENKLLPPLILWCLYFLIKNKNIPAAAFALLILMVKEDAFIYVLAIGIWLIASNRKKLFGAGLITASVIYFIFATKMIEASGGEPMLSRFNNFYPEGAEKTLSTAIKTAVLDFGYLLKEIFTAPKLEFLMWTLIPTCFAVFFGGKISTLTLLAPIIIQNLLSNWKYQFDIAHQYTFGPMTLLIFATILTLCEFDEKKKTRFLTLMLSLCIVATSALSLTLVSTKVSWYSSQKAQYIEASGLIEKYKETLDGASVTSCDRITPHLYFVRDLSAYKVSHNKLRETEFFVVDTRISAEDLTELRAYLDSNYVLLDKASFVEIWEFSYTEELPSE